MEHYKLEDITIEITQDCPLQCVHCSTFNGHDDDKGILNTKTITNIANQAIPLGLKSISLSGGEPCTHPDLVNLVRQLKKLGLSISIYSCGATNGGRSHFKPLKNNLLRDLSNAGLDRIIYNLQSSVEEVHERISFTKHSFSSVLDSIESSINLNISTELHLVPLKQNLSTIPLVIDLAKNLGLSRVSLLRFVPQGRGAIDYKSKMLESHEFQELSKMVNSSNGFLRLGSPFNFLDHSNKSPCTAGLDKLVIRSNGIVYACEAFKQSTMNLGNINYSSMHEIWHSKNIFSFRRALQERFSCNHDYRSFENCFGQEISLNSTSNLKARSHVEHRQACVI